MAVVLWMCKCVCTIFRDGGREYVLLLVCQRWSLGFWGMGFCFNRKIWEERGSIGSLARRVLCSCINKEIPFF
jgi:hypothetical protein